MPYGFFLKAMDDKNRRGARKGRVMELHEKLQELRKSRGLTQEELAQALFVSRTAVSKWESGRGYPNIESLKAISRYFSVSLDDLLSSGALLTLAEEENRRREEKLRDRVFGLLDCCMALLFFFPFFAQRAEGTVRAVSLLALEGTAWYGKIPQMAFAAAMTLCGVVTLALQNGEAAWWMRWKDKISLGLSAAAALLFIAGLHPYAAAFAFVFLVIKALMMIKWA